MEGGTQFISWSKFILIIFLRTLGLLAVSLIASFPLSLIVGVLMYAFAILCAIIDVFSDAPIGGGLHSFVLSDNYWSIYWFSFALCVAGGCQICLHPEVFDYKLTNAMKHILKTILVLLTISAIIFAILNINLVFSLIFGPIAILIGYIVNGK